MYEFEGLCGQRRQGKDFGLRDDTKESGQRHVAERQQLAFVMQSCQKPPGFFMMGMIITICGNQNIDIKEDQ